MTNMSPMLQCPGAVVQCSQATEIGNCVMQAWLRPAHKTFILGLPYVSGLADRQQAMDNGL